MNKIIAVAAFVLWFAVGTAHAQRSPSGGGAVNGGNGGMNSGGGGGGGGTGVGGALPAVIHHPVWIPPANVSATNDGPFLPSSYQSYDKAVEIGKSEVGTREPSVAEVAKMTQQQKATAAKARFVVVQDVEGKLQEVKAQP
jgi:hypothetical protein